MVDADLGGPVCRSAREHTTFHLDYDDGLSVWSKTNDVRLAHRESEIFHQDAIATLLQVATRDPLTESTDMVPVVS